DHISGRILDRIDPDPGELPHFPCWVVVTAVRIMSEFACWPRTAGYERCGNAGSIERAAESSAPDVAKAGVLIIAISVENGVGAEIRRLSPPLHALGNDTGVFRRIGKREDANLADVAEALGRLRRLSGLGESREEQGDQDGDDA